MIIFRAYNCFVVRNLFFFFQIQAFGTTQFTQCTRYDHRIVDHDLDWNGLCVFLFVIYVFTSFDKEIEYHLDYYLMLNAVNIFNRLKFEENVMKSCIHNFQSQHNLVVTSKHK